MNYAVSDLHNSKKMGQCCSGSSVYLPEGTHVHHIPSGNRQRAYVVRVIDGDTLELVIQYKLSTIIAPYTESWRDRYTTISITKTCRLSGIDAAEKNTKQGQHAAKLLKDKLRTMSTLWVYIVEEHDKYGRTLVELYETKTAHDTIYADWVGKDFEGLGRVYVSYDGGKKSDYMKHLSKIEKTAK